MRVLRLSEVDHLVVLQRVEPAVQMVGYLVATGEDIPEEGERRVILPLPPPRHGGRHIGDITRLGRPEDDFQYVHQLTHYFTCSVFVVLMALAVDFLVVVFLVVAFVVVVDVVPPL